MKLLFEKLVAFSLLIFCLPFLGIVYIAVKLEDGGSLIFKQKRCGKDKRTFVLYKIRTMVEGAEELKKKYKHLNEADGPVFKIREDPRYTKVGRLLAHTGFDEIPQLINIIKGEMAFVGPRPLPLDEAKEVPNRYKKRFDVLPGITSSWVIKGTHSLSFKKWMELDLEDVENKGLFYNIYILFRTGILILREIFKKLKKHPLFLIILVSLGTGLFLRFYLVGTRVLWADEVFYFKVAKDYSLRDILLVNHWIKDNPPLFLLFIKAWSTISNSIFWLRLSGIIAYVVSFLLLVRLLRHTDRLTLFVVTFLFSTSVYFSYINYWISPYNFAVLFSLVQLNLILGLMEGKIGGKKFIFSFAITNFLLINTHYSSVYFFLSYPVFLLYFLFTKKKQLKTFAWGLLGSLLFLLPTLFLIFVHRTEIYNIQQHTLSVFFTSLPRTFFYIFDKVLFRINSLLMTKKIIFLILVACVLTYLSGPRVKRAYTFSFFALFFPALIFLFAFYRVAPTIVEERPLWIFHAVYYFGIGVFLNALRKTNTFLQVAFISLFLLVGLMALNRELGRDNEYSHAGQVSWYHFFKKDHDKFVSDLVENVQSDGYTLVYYDYNEGFRDQNIYQGYIFLNYYLNYDQRLEQVKHRRAVVTNDMREIENKVNADNEKLLIVNFYQKGSRGDLILKERILEKYGVEVVDYWRYVVKS